MMKILSAQDYSQRLRVSIQASGKLSLTNETVRCLGIDASSRVVFGQDDADPKVLYFILPDDRTRQDAFEVRASGKYFYVPTKTMFDALGIDYTSDGAAVLFDLVRMESMDEEAGGKVFRMSNREVADDVE